MIETASHLILCAAEHRLNTRTYRVVAEQSRARAQPEPSQSRVRAEPKQSQSKARAEPSRSIGALLGGHELLRIKTS